MWQEEKDERVLVFTRNVRAIRYIRMVNLNIYYILIFNIFTVISIYTYLPSWFIVYPKHSSRSIHPKEKHSSRSSHYPHQKKKKKEEAPIIFQNQTHFSIFQGKLYIILFNIIIIIIIIF